MRPCVCAWVCVIVSTDPHWQMRHFWAIVSMDPYCCLCIHIPHYPHPRPDLNHNPNPIPKPKYWPNVKLFIRISTNTYNPTCLPTEWRQSYATNQQLVRTVGRFLLAELTIRRFVSTTRQGCSLGLEPQGLVYKWHFSHNWKKTEWYLCTQILFHRYSISV